MNIEEKMFSIDRPHPNLLKYYFISSLLTGPGFFFMFPVLFFRYHTLHYKFDNEGITMRWGILFRKEIHLTYARIQDIHLVSGVIQRWLGLGNIQIQTASGSSAAEMVIEGLTEYEELRNFIYAKMRGYKEGESDETSETAVDNSSDEVLELLQRILQEMKLSRENLEKAVNAKGV
jgi:putative membrane protein